jgi:hypothetical protein
MVARGRRGRLGPRLRELHGRPDPQGVPLVTGVDLLAQYAYLGFIGSLVVQTDHDPDATPTYENLGERATSTS